MTPLSTNRLFTAVPAFAVATPFIALDQDAPAPKPQDKPKDKSKDKSKAKAKPAPARKLSDFETEAIKRIAKLDPALAGKLRAKLPVKKNKQDQAGYIRKRIGKLDKARKLFKDLNKGGFADEKGLAKGLKRLAEIEKELGHLERFYKYGRFPKWYKKLLEKREKDKLQKPSPTTKPTTKPAKKPASQSNGAGREPDGLLISFIT